METRWAPTIVINGVLNRIKWPYKWISGVISLLYRSYSGHLLLAGTHYCRWWHWRFLGVTKKFSRGLRILSEILRSPTASHIQLPSWLVRTSLRVSKWRSSSRSDQSDQHALALQVWRDHRVRGVVEKKNRGVTDLEPFFASMILDENAKFGKQILFGILGSGRVAERDLAQERPEGDWMGYIYIYISLLPNGLALDGAYSPMASPWDHSAGWSLLPNGFLCHHRNPICAHHVLKTNGLPERGYYFPRRAGGKVYRIQYTQ